MFTCKVQNLYFPLSNCLLGVILCKMFPHVVAIFLSNCKQTEVMLTS